MKRPLDTLPPNNPENDQWQELICQRARALPYPPTPNVADQVMARLASGPNRGVARLPLALRPLWVAGILLALLLGLWAVPPVRAAILEFLQIGVVRIWLVEPTATPLPTATPPATVASAQAGAATTPAPFSITRPTPTPLNSFLQLAGKTTLAEATTQVGFPIRLPTYPADLGPPDGVFYQQLGGPAVVLVWVNPEHPDQARYSLHIFGNGAFVEKTNPAVVMTTTVNGSEAAWMHGPYILSYGDGSQSSWELRYLVSGRVLVWQEDGLTYRLESDLSLEEAIRMAESLE